MHCQECANHVSSTLTNISGVDKVECDLKSQQVSVWGTSAPSSIVNAIQSIGKDAILRGAGSPDSAAVCILESFTDEIAPVKGLARIVTVSPHQTLFDITLNGLSKGSYFVSIRNSGDLSDGPLSTGSEMLSLGSILVDQKLNNKDTLIAQKSGYFGNAFVSRNITVSDLIGRGITVSLGSENVSKDSLVGIIARSAGVWENTKTVCSCSGKTLWQERSDAVSTGIN